MHGKKLAEPSAGGGGAAVIGWIRQSFKAQADSGLPEVVAEEVPSRCRSQFCHVVKVTASGVTLV